MISFCIYILAGREIFIKRNQLRAFRSPLYPEPVRIETSRSFKTTEVSVTSELAVVDSPNASNAFVMPDKKQPDINQKGYDQYSLAIGSAPVGPRFEVLPPMIPRSHSTIAQCSNRTAMEANRAAFGYTRVALLFFVSLLVTWVLPPFDLPVTRPEKTNPTHVTTGPLLHQPGLFPRLPQCLPPFQLRLGYCPPLDGFLECDHLHHDFLDRCAIIVQRKSERK